MSGEAKSYAGYASASSDYSRTVAFREAQGWYERSVSEAQTLYEEAAQYDEGARLQEMLNAHETQIDPSVRPRQTRRRPASTGENKDGAAAGDESDAEFLEPGHRNMAALLLAAPVMAVPDRRAFIVERADGTNDAMTFRELWNGAKAVCEGLRRAGLRKGDRAIVMVPMSPELYVVLIALFKLGATAVFIDPWMGIKKVAHFAGIADPRAFIGPQKAHALRKLNKGVDAIPIQVLVELGGTGATFTGCAGCIAALCCVGRGALSFRGMLRDFEGDDTICDVAADDVALITFTTGSSGQPKGITRTHGILTSQQEVRLESETSCSCLMAAFSVRLSLARALLANRYIVLFSITSSYPAPPPPIPIPTPTPDRIRAPLKYSNDLTTHYNGPRLHSTCAAPPTCTTTSI